MALIVLEEVDGGKEQIIWTSTVNVVRENLQNILQSGLTMRLGQGWVNFDLPTSLDTRLPKCEGHLFSFFKNSDQKSEEKLDKWSTASRHLLTKRERVHKQL